MNFWRQNFNHISTENKHFWKVIFEMNDYPATYTVCLNCLKRLTLNSSLCFVNFLMTIFNKTIIGLCQLFIFVLILVIIYFIDPLFILFPNLPRILFFQLKIKLHLVVTYMDLATGALKLYEGSKVKSQSSQNFCQVKV